MITSDTPYKLTEIIQDTWPGLYRSPNSSYNETKQMNDDSDSKTTPD